MLKYFILKKDFANYQKIILGNYSKIKNNFLLFSHKNLDLIYIQKLTYSEKYSNNMSKGKYNQRKNKDFYFQQKDNIEDSDFTNKSNNNQRFIYFKNLKIEHLLFKNINFNY